MKKIGAFLNWFPKNNLDIQLTENEKLNNLVELVWEWNKKINITASKSKEEIITRHILDSLTALSFLKNENNFIVDIGSGGGFPALPLSIELSNVNFILVERVPKKCAFLNRVKRKLQLDNITVVNSDLKDLKLNQSISTATTRAVRVDEELIIYLKKLKVENLITFTSEKEKNSNYYSYILPNEKKIRYVNYTNL